MNQCPKCNGELVREVNKELQIVEIACRDYTYYTSYDLSK